MSDEEQIEENIRKYIKGHSTTIKAYTQEYVDKKDKEIEILKSRLEEYQELQEIIDKAIEYINEYAWQEDIIGYMWTTTGNPVKDRYMRLEWDNCNELLEILKGEDKK